MLYLRDYHQEIYTEQEEIPTLCALCINMKDIIEKAADYFKNLFNNPLIKIVGAEATVLAQSFADAKLAVLTVISLVTIDTILGLILASRYGSLSSWGFRKSLYKLSFYLIIIFIGSMSYVLWGVPWIKEAFVGLIISTEIISIMENTEMCFPGSIPKVLISRLKLSIHKKRIKHCKQQEIRYVNGVYITI